MSQTPVSTIERISGKLRGIRGQVRRRYTSWRVNSKRQDLSKAPVLALDNQHLLSRTIWTEPNRLDNPPLHLAQRLRFATLTGVSWLDQSTFITLHRNGQRMGIFNPDRSSDPIAVFEVTHQADDIAAQPVGMDSWRIAVSGCWDCSYSSFRLARVSGDHDQYTIEHEQTLKEPSRGFSHGVSFDHLGQICCAIQDGDIRIVIGKEVHRLPRPWGPRKVIFDPARRRYLVAAVSKNANRTAYEIGQTAVWSCHEGGRTWKCISAIDGVHSDSIGVSEDHIWLPDQNGDRLLRLDANTGKLEAVLSSESLDFPHGLDVSGDGKIAVTNYGSSSVAVFRSH